MRKPLCLCSLFTEILTDTFVTVVMSPLEWNKTTNTGRLAGVCLENSSIFIRGEKGKTLESSRMIDPDRENLVLFPGGENIRSWRDVHVRSRVNLIVPDGTWESSVRIIAREPVLARLKRVSVSVNTPESLKLRKSAVADRLSTLEALAAALAVLESDGGRASSLLRSVLKVKQERILWARGSLRTDEASTGIPAEAVEWKTAPRIDPDRDELPDAFEPKP